MACPHVTGVVALMLSHEPSATPSQIFDALTVSARNPNTDGSDSSLGHGIVDAVAAIEALSNDGGGGGDSPPPEDPPMEDQPVEDPPNNGGDDNPDCVQLLVTLQTDRYGSDTAHWLKSADGEFLFFRNGLGSFETYQESACLVPFGCYVYQIRDVFCDGIIGEGVEIR